MLRESSFKLDQIKIPGNRVFSQNSSSGIAPGVTEF